MVKLYSFMKYGHSKEKEARLELISVYDPVTTNENMFPRQSSLLEHPDAIPVSSSDQFSDCWKVEVYSVVHTNFEIVQQIVTRRFWPKLIRIETQYIYSPLFIICNLKIT